MSFWKHRKKHASKGANEIESKWDRKQAVKKNKQAQNTSSKSTSLHEKSPKKCKWWICLLPITHVTSQNTISYCTQNLYNTKSYSVCPLQSLPYPKRTCFSLHYPVVVKETLQRHSNFATGHLSLSSNPFPHPGIELRYMYAFLAMHSFTLASN